MKGSYSFLFNVEVELGSIVLKTEILFNWRQVLPHNVVHMLGNIIPLK